MEIVPGILCSVLIVFFRVFRVFRGLSRVSIVRQGAEWWSYEGLCLLPAFLGMVTAMSYWKDKIVLVTGGSSGLGRVIADGFGGAGAKIVIAGLEEDAVQRSAAEMQAAGCNALGIQADITQQADVDRLFAEAIRHYGKLDVLVNNAGRSMRGKVLDTTPEQFRDLLELNLIALVRVHAGGCAALAGGPRARRQHRFAGGEVGIALGRGLSGHEARRGGLFAATPPGVGAAGAARPPGLSWADRAQGPAALSTGRTGRHSRACPAARGGRADEGHSAAISGRADFAGLRATPAGDRNSRQGAVVVCASATLAEPGRLDRVEEDVMRATLVSSPLAA